MTTNQVPYLCGGTMFSLLLVARKPRTKARNKLNGGSDGLSDTDVMEGLIEVVTSETFISCHGDTFNKTTSCFKTCQKYGTTYIPFTNPSIINAFNTSFKQKNSDTICKMSEFIDKFISKVHLEWLAKAFIEVIQSDNEISPSTNFFIASEYEVSKEDFDNITEVDMPIFLLSILNFILNERKDNTKGRPTFEKWHTQSGKNTQWKYVGNVGDSITRKIVVNVNAELDDGPTTKDTFFTDIEDYNQLKNQNGSVNTTSRNIDDILEHIKENSADNNQDYITMKYSPEDQALLNDFTIDYDEIMVSLINENYAYSLIDMSLPCKIEELYKTKWASRSNSFNDPSLKSYVFGLLGELNSISNQFLTGNGSSLSLNNSRNKIRNLYVKLHSDHLDNSFPFDVFIDDWDDGEF